jgi:protease YdgD
MTVEPLPLRDTSEGFATHLPRGGVELSKSASARQTWRGSPRWSSILLGLEQRAMRRLIKRGFSALFCYAVIMFTTNVGSGQELHPGIIGEDDRVRVDKEGPPWDAVGQVNISSYRIAVRCTGTLVKSNLVLTAAHCVMDPWKKTPYPLHDIHFSVGVRGAENKGHSTAKCLRFPKDYEYVGRDWALPSVSTPQVPLRTLEKDAVVIVLHEKLTPEPVLMAERVVPRPGLRLVHAAYPADRRFVLSAHFNCHLLRADLVKPFWFNDCDTHPASSGGPVFTETEGQLKLVAIMLAMGGRISNPALPISEWLSLTDSTTCP